MTPPGASPILRARGRLKSDGEAGELDFLSFLKLRAGLIMLLVLFTFLRSLFTFVVEVFALVIFIVLLHTLSELLLVLPLFSIEVFVRVFLIPPTHTGGALQSNYLRPIRGNPPPTVLMTLSDGPA